MSYSNRQNTYVSVNNEFNSKPIVFPLVLRPLEKIQISIEQFRMNHLIDNITPLNNQLNISHALGDINITIPTGFYDAHQLRDYLKVVLSDYSMTCLYEKYTYKFVSTYPFTILNTSTCKKVLGLGDDDESATLYPAYTLICPKKGDLNQHFVNMKIKELNVHYIKTGINLDNTFCKIPINCLYGQVIYVKPTVVYLLQKSNFRSITVQLEDDYGNDLNGLGFDIVFKIEHVFTLPDQEIVEEEKKDDETDIDLSRFTHYDGNVKVRNSGGFLL